MKPKKTIPTIVGLVLLLIGMSAGVFLVKNRQLFKVKADLEVIPKDIRFSNITDSSFTISWFTSKESRGFLAWGNNKNNLNRTALNSLGEKSNLYYITIDDLSPDTDYYFKINSDNHEFDNEGIPWHIKTGQKLESSTTPSHIFGSIQTSDGPLSSSIIVYATVAGSSPLSTLTTEAGNWVVPVSNVRSKNLESLVDVNESESVIEIVVQGGVLGVSSAQIYFHTARPVPTINIGNSYDFKSLSPQEENLIPEANINLPGKTTPPEVTKTSLEEETPTPSLVAQNQEIQVSCEKVKAHNTSWKEVPMNELELLNPGESVFFTISCNTTFGELDKAIFLINGKQTTDIYDRRQKSGDFYYEYVIRPEDLNSTIVVYSWIHHLDLDGWY